MRKLLLFAAGLLVTLGLIGLVGGPAAADDRPAPASPAYDGAFWKHWGDGRAEVAGYDLTFPRYGETRQGTAVAIFVTEDFANGPRVKADAKGPGTFPVIKLNLAKDFPTGVYDYHLMTSAFVHLSPANGEPAGFPTKVSFSAQEWCGHAYHQVLFDPGKTRETLHSYFQGEADREAELAHPAHGLSEDALPLWARGVAAPALQPGEQVTLPILESLQEARLRHQRLAWSEATLRRSAEPTQVTVPAGTFAADVYEAELESGRSWTFHVEHAAPHRLLRWTCSTGERAELLKAARMPYWQMHGAGGESALSKLGLEPRPPRTP